MKTIFVIVGISLAPLLLTAQKYDYQWPMGYSSDPPLEVFGISMLDFTGAAIDVYPYNQEFGPTQMGNSASFICDENGELLLMTNNCRVFDKDFNIVSGADTLTPGVTFNNFCDQYGEYPTSQTSLILPELGNDSTFYVVHKDSELSDSLQAKISKNLYLSTVVKKVDGSFYLKEKIILLNMLMIHGKLTACISKEGNRWWTWTAGHDTNYIYKFLIGGPDGAEGPFIQEIGDPLYGKVNDNIGQSSFSPDGTMLGMLTNNNNVLLYDFANESGEFSNYRVIPVAEEDEGFGTGLAFSFDSRFIYVTTVKNLYQLDLQDTTVQHIAFHESYDEDGWPVGMGKMHLGPDCRIYMDPGSTTYYIHVIHHPNQKGEACGFEARALRSPTNISHFFPNLPMYRFGGACDSTIQFPMVNSVKVEKVERIQVFPNPFASDLTVSFKNSIPKDVHIRMYDSLGRNYFESPLPAFTNTLTLGSIPSGLYFYEIWENNTLLKSGKLVKVE